MVRSELSGRNLEAFGFLSRFSCGFSKLHSTSPTNTFEDFFTWPEYSFPKNPDKVQVVFGLFPMFFLGLQSFILRAWRKGLRLFAWKFCLLSALCLDKLQNIFGFLLKLFLWDFQNCILRVDQKLPTKNICLPYNLRNFCKKKWKFRKFFSTAMSKQQFRSPEDRFWNFSGKTWNYLSLSDINWKFSAFSRNHYRLRCQKCTVSVQQIALTVFFPWKIILFLDFPAILSNKSVFE